ncbi:MAG: hypothetical protein M0R66_06345 [Candidatus Omnitrophica bacterium]|jgi:hypothetical protein|nr:hypothetical protein [Candidatus Omnitrophota bacterium]
MNRNVRRIIFPHGIGDPKGRFLALGFRNIGVKVIVEGEARKIGVIEFRLEFEDGREVTCGHDIGCLQKNELSRGKGEERPWWEGRIGEVFFFKTHASPSVLSTNRRIFPIPQAIGREVFLSMIPEERARVDRVPPTLDVFGVFTAGGARAEACRRVMEGPWKSIVGIMRRRKHSMDPLPLSIMTAPLDPGLYFKTMAASRLALSFPSHGEGGEGPWCSFRTVEAWSLGVPVVTFRPSNYYVFARPEEPFWFEVAADLSDLGLVLNEALSDSARLADFRARSRAHFDRHFAPVRVAEYVARTVEEAWR